MARDARLLAARLPQRFTGALSENGKEIAGRWEINHDGTWEHDFDLTFVKVS